MQINFNYEIVQYKMNTEHIYTKLITNEMCINKQLNWLVNEMVSKSLIKMTHYCILLSDPYWIQWMNECMHACMVHGTDIHQTDRLIVRNI